MGASTSSFEQNIQSSNITALKNDIELAFLRIDAEADRIITSILENGYANREEVCSKIGYQKVDEMAAFFPITTLEGIRYRLGVVPQNTPALEQNKQQVCLDIVNFYLRKINLITNIREELPNCRNMENNIYTELTQKLQTANINNDEWLEAYNKMESFNQEIKNRYGMIEQELGKIRDAKNVPELDKIVTSTNEILSGTNAICKSYEADLIVYSSKLSPKPPIISAPSSTRYSAVTSPLMSPEDFQKPGEPTGEPLMTPAQFESPLMSPEDIKNQMLKSPEEFFTPKIPVAVSSPPVVVSPPVVKPVVSTPPVVKPVVKPVSSPAVITPVKPVVSPVSTPGVITSPPVVRPVVSSPGRIVGPAVVTSPTVITPVPPTPVVSPAGVLVPSTNRAEQLLRQRDLEKRLREKQLGTRQIKIYNNRVEVSGNITRRQAASLPRSNLVKVEPITDKPKGLPVRAITDYNPLIRPEVSLKKGEPVVIIKTENGWALVEKHNGEEGYVPLSYLSN